MPFFPSLTLANLSRLAPSLMVAATLLLTGCQDNHIGRPCDLGVNGTPDQNVATINPGALECPSRICILPVKEKTTDTGALCTAECGGNDDCADGEIGSGDRDPRCNTGFVCRRILPHLDNNPLSCKPVCVCRDFLLSEDPADSAPPPSCK